MGVTKIISCSDIHFPQLKGIEDLKRVLKKFIEQCKKIVKKEAFSCKKPLTIAFTCCIIIMIHNILYIRIVKITFQRGGPAFQ
jgi:hypothetical protein